MRPKRKIYTPSATDDDRIVASVTPAAGGEQSLTIAESTVDSVLVARPLMLTTVADETGRTFTITGTNWFGQTITESLTGVNNTTAFTVNEFKEVSSITVDDDTAGAIKFGIGGTWRTPFIPMNTQITPVNISFALYWQGTSPSFTAKVQHTLSNLQYGITALDNTDLEIMDHENATGLTSSNDPYDDNYAFPIAGIRTEVTGWTAGSLGFDIIQAR